MFLEFLTYLIIVFSVGLISYKLKKYGLNLLRFNFLVFLLISLVPFCVLYGDYFQWELSSFYALRVFYALVFLGLILVDTSKIAYERQIVTDKQIIYALGAISFLITLFYVALIGPKNFPLFNVFSSSYIDLIAMREDSYKLANIPVVLSYVVFYNKYFLIPLFCATLPVFWKEINKAFILFVVPSMVMNQLLTLSKTAFFLMILSALVAYIFLAGITVKRLLFTTLMVLLVPLLILYAIEQDRDFIVTVVSILNRLFLIPESSSLDYYSLFLDGKFDSITSSIVFSIFNHKEIVNVQNYVFLQLTPIVLLQEGTAPGNIFGIAYVDVNEYLIVVYYFVILLFLFWLNRFILVCKSRMVIPFQVSASIGLSFIYFTNFTTTLNSYGIFFLIIMVYVVIKYPGGVRLWK